MGGTKLWTEQQTVTVNKGYFSVLLGEGSQFNSEANGALSLVFDGADASDRFIGLTVISMVGVCGDCATVAPNFAVRIHRQQCPAPDRWQWKREHLQ